MCNNQIWDLVVTVSVLYPVLADVGAYLHAPMLIRTDTQSCEAFTSLFRSLGIAKIFDLGKNPHQFEGDVRGAFDDQILVFRYRQSRYISENMQTVLTFCVEETTSRETQALTVILADRRVSPSVQDSVSGEIHPGELSNESVPYYKELWKTLVDTILREQGWFLNRLGKEIIDNGDRNIPVFKAATECLSLVYRQMRDDDPLFESLRETVENHEALLSQIYDAWDGEADTEYCTYIFAQGLIDLFTTRSMTAVKRFGECSHEMIDDLYSLVIYDDSAYYFSEDLFSEICSGLPDDVDSEDIKEGLSEGGVLIIEKRGNSVYYSKKTTIGLIDGTSERPRLMKLDRQAIDKLSNFNLLELIDIGKGGKEDAYQIGDGASDEADAEDF